MKKIVSGVYVIRNRLNGKIYVGSSIDIESRWKQHKRLFKKNKHGNTYLQRAWDKHEELNFEFYVLEETTRNKKDIIDTEQYFLDLYKPYERNIGYNINRIADSCLGIKKTKEQIIVMSNNRKEFWKNEKNKEKMIFSFNNVRNKKESARRASKTIIENGTRKGDKNNMFGTNCYEIWLKKFGKEYADIKQKEVLEINKQKNSGKNNAMFGKKRQEVSKLNVKIKSKPILQYNLDGSFKKEYPSVSEAARINRFSRGGLKNFRNHPMNFALGFIWKYKNESNV